MAAVATSFICYHYSTLAYSNSETALYIYVCRRRKLTPALEDIDLLPPNTGTPLPSASLPSPPRWKQHRQQRQAKKRKDAARTALDTLPALRTYVIWYDKIKWYTQLQVRTDNYLPCFVLFTLPALRTYVAWYNTMKWYRQLQVRTDNQLSCFLFFLFFASLLLSSLWTSCGLRCRPFSPPVRAFSSYRA